MTVRYQSIAVRQQRQRRLLVAVVAILLALVLAMGFFLGRSAAYSGMGIDPRLFRELQADRPAAQERQRSLEQELELLRTRNEVDRASLEMVRGEIAGQKERIADLEEALRFYRGLMAPGEIAQGLSLREPELVALEQPGHVAFRIVAQQEARKHSTLRGSLSAEVLGLQEGEQVSYPLSDLSEDLDSNAVTLRFRYFQSIEGEMTLPEGFEPRRIDLVAQATTPRKREVREQFPWQIKERFTHVGK